MPIISLFPSPAERVAAVAKVMGPDETENTLVPFILESVDDEDEVLYTLAAIFYVGSGLALLVLWPLHCACKQLLIHGDRARMATIVVAAATAIGAIGTLAAAIGGHR